MPTTDGNIVVLDTDVWSLLFAVKKRRSEHEEQWRSVLTGRSVVIAAQTRAELLAWPLIRDFGERRHTTILSLLDSTPTIPVDEIVIQQFAQLTADTRRRGIALAQRPHVADRWVAATAMAHDAPLLARDSIYSDVPGIDLL